MAHGLSHSATCGIFLDQGSNPCPCIGRWILNHCATRGAPIHIFPVSLFKSVSRRYLTHSEESHHCLFVMSLNLYVFPFLFFSLPLKKYIYFVSILTIDLKQIHYQIFLQQRWVCPGSAENYNLGSATMGSHAQVPAWQGKENLFMGLKRKFRGLNRVHGLSLADESLPGKKRSLYSSY